MIPGHNACLNSGTFGDPHEMGFTEIIYHALAPSMLCIEIIHLLGIIIRYWTFSLAVLHESQYHSVNSMLHHTHRLSRSLCLNRVIETYMETKLCTCLLACTLG